MHGGVSRCWVSPHVPRVQWCGLESPHPQREFQVPVGALQDLMIRAVDLGDLPCLHHTPASLHAMFPSTDQPTVGSSREPCGLVPGPLAMPFSQSFCAPPPPCPPANCVLSFNTQVTCRFCRQHPHPPLPPASLH